MKFARRSRRASSRAQRKKRSRRANKIIRMQRAGQQPPPPARIQALGSYSKGNVSQGYLLAIIVMYTIAPNGAISNIKLSHSYGFPTQSTIPILATDPNPIATASSTTNGTLTITMNPSNYEHKYHDGFLFDIIASEPGSNGTRLMDYDLNKKLFLTSVSIKQNGARFAAPATGIRPLPPGAPNPSAYNITEMDYTRPFTISGLPITVPNTATSGGQWWMRPPQPPPPRPPAPAPKPPAPAPPAPKPPAPAPPAPKPPAPAPAPAPKPPAPAPKPPAPAPAPVPTPLAPPVAPPGSTTNSIVIGFMASAFGRPDPEYYDWRNGVPK